jgi:hypothetical protein
MTTDLTVQSVLRNYSPAQFRQIAQKLSPDDRIEVEEIIEDWQCSESSLYWLQNLTKTENPKHADQGLQFKEPFPRKDYFAPIFQAFNTEDRLFIPKTREMLTSWCVMGDSAAKAQWHRWFIVTQTEAEAKAFELVSYVRILYENQPQWLKERHPLKSEPSKNNIEWADGGRVLAIPAGENKIRLYHPTRYVMDEAAFLPEAEQCFNAAAPVCQQIIAISSAGPGWFGNQCSR